MTMTRGVGLDSFDLQFTTVVTGTAGTPSYGIVGLNTFNMSNAAYTGTYDSSAATWATGASSSGGSIASNAAYNLASNVSIGGVVYYSTASAPSGTSYNSGKTKMSGSIATPSTPSAGSYTSSNSNPSIGLPTSGANANYSGGSMSVGGGNYVLSSCSVSGATIQFTGPATIWMYGGMNLNNATFLAYQNKPTNLQIKFCQSAGFNLTNSTVYGVVTAPTGSSNINGGSRLVGSIVVQDLSVDGSSIYYDSQLGTNGAGTSAGSAVVQ
ncbi:MAG TPA: hypothetical protein VF796_10385 [Humisphaera sp.]